MTQVDKSETVLGSGKGEAVLGRYRYRRGGTRMRQVDKGETRVRQYWEETGKGEEDRGSSRSCGVKVKVSCQRGHRGFG